MQKMEQTIDSREVAEMIEKEHRFLLRDIRRYEDQFAEAQIGSGEFFRSSEYKDLNSQTRPCYRITKKGCEFIAHKLTGVKGTIFTARYINRFHKMEDILAQKEIESELPWFIRRFRGKYIMLFRDFEAITGVKLCGNYTSVKRTDSLKGGLDYNGWAWHTTVDKQKFKQEYGFDYGEDDCMMYLYSCGIIQALRMLENDKKVKVSSEAQHMIMDGVTAIEKCKHNELKMQDTSIKLTPQKEEQILKIELRIL